MNECITPLHVWSGYSPGRGPCRVGDLVAQARRLGHSRLALTDVNGLYGAPAFAQAACDAGITPLIGAQLEHGPHRLVALCDSDAGYANLCRLLSQLHCTPDFDLPLSLPSFSDGLQFLLSAPSTACLLASSPSLTNRLWLALDPSSQPRSHLLSLLRFSRDTHLPLVASAPALFLRSSDLPVARLLAAIRLGATYDNVPAGELPPAGGFLRGPEALARQLSEFPAALAANRLLADRCEGFRLLPRQPVFPAFAAPAGELLRLCRAGALRRYPAGPPEGFEARLERELSLIESKNFTGYFLVVWDIVQFARRRNAPVAGRGSGASSLVAYLLGITNVCPLAHRIPFERFLNEGRQDYPDLDVDFCWRIRDEVIDYALARWGGGRAAMVCTHGTFQTASAIRETAKAFGMSDEQISTMTREGEWEDGTGSQIVELARGIEGLLHTISVHPGGIVIAPEGVDAHAPIQPAAKGVNVTQYDKDGVEAVGLVKIDLLGNRSLSTIRAATDLVAARTGERLDIESLPAGDASTIAMLQAGDTVGCNQLESPAMRSLLRAIRPTGTADLMKALALIRPGAASLGMKDAFIRRQRGLEAAPPIDPRVDALLADTHGVMLYEDDVMQTAAALLGAAPAQADRFRKAIQKCRDDADRLALSREFLAGCRAAGVADACAKDLWVQMAKFNAYSFCRAHAGSYAVPAYAVAYLKRHWPREFWTAALNNNQSMYLPRVYVEQAKRMGVRFAGPDVNRSEAQFRLDGDVIRAGLERVAGVGPGAAGALLAARQSGPFTGLSDFAARTRLPKPAVRALVLCGAMDSFARPRPTLMLELALCRGAPAATGALLTAEPALPIGPDFDPGRKFLDEWLLLGFSVGPHILSLYRPALAGRTDADSRRLGALVGRTVVIAGMLEARRLTRTQAGREMLFLTLDDEYGLFEATVFLAAARELPRTFDAYGPYVITGKVERQYDSIGIAAERVVVFSQQTVAKPQAVTDTGKRICRTGSNT